VQTLFAWVHLSDIQWGHGDAGQRADQQMVLERLRADIAGAEARGCPKANAIVVTGDVAFSGAAAEYAGAKGWLGEVAKAAGGVGAEHIFVVPGNHDVDRTADKKRDVGRLIDDLREGKDALDTVLADEEDRERLTRRMKPYLAFAGELGPGCGEVFWVHRFEARGGQHIRLVGLNTAVLSAGEDDKGKLRLGKSQLHAALTSVEAGELVVVLSHHPFQGGWLADQVEADRWSSNHAHVHLFGHTHDADSEVAISGAGGRFVRVAGGRAHGDKGQHGYSIAALVRADGGDLMLRIWPRRWSDKNKELRSDVGGVPEGQTYAEHKLRFAVASDRPQPPARKTVLFEGPGGVPIAEVPHFLGRDHEMVELRMALAEDKAVCVVAVGLGGIGKTSLIRQFVATEAAAVFPDGAVWIDAMNLPGEAARAAQRFGWRAERLPTVEEAGKWLATVLHDKRVLVVIDNVDPARVELMQLPVVGGKSRTVITSRAVAIHESLGKPALSLAIACWTDGICRAYLREMVPALGKAADADLDALADFVGRLPLAVRLVAKLLLRPGATPVRLLDRLKDEPLGTLETVATGADRGIAATFQAAYQELDETRRKVLLALAACARVTGENVIAQVAGMAADKVADVLPDLAERSLIECADAEARRWTLHDVVRLFVRRRDGIDRADEAHLMFAGTHVESHQDPSDWQAMEADMHEVLAAVDRLVQSGDGWRAWGLVGRAGEHLSQRGRYGEFKARLTQIALLLPEGSGYLAMVLSNLGACYYWLGDIPEAIDHQQRSLAIDERLGQLEGQANTLGNLGLCYLEQGDLPKAIDHQKRALAINETLGRLRFQASQLGNLGICYVEQGDLPKAIDHLQRALAILENLGWLPGQADPLSNLAQCYGRQGDLAKAIDHVQRALAIEEKLGRLEGQANQLSNLGLLYEVQGDLPKSIDYRQRSLALYRRMGFPDDHRSVRRPLAALTRLAPSS
jgi:tetratricopeptide (TPR) repeat protein